MTHCHCDRKLAGLIETNEDLSDRISRIDSENNELRRTVKEQEEERVKILIENRKYELNSNSRNSEIKQLKENIQKLTTESQTARDCRERELGELRDKNFELIQEVLNLKNIIEFTKSDEIKIDPVIEDGYKRRENQLISDNSDLRLRLELIEIEMKKLERKDFDNSNMIKKLEHENSKLNQLNSNFMISRINSMIGE